MTLAEIAPPTGQDVTIWKYIILGLFTVGGLAAAITAILKLGDRFRTPYATALEFAEYKRRQEWLEAHIDLTLKQRVEVAEKRIDQVFEKIDEVQATMTAAAEGRSEKILLAIESLQKHR